MSFLRKAVTKVFNFVKKVVTSKVFKWVAIAAVIFFTAGVAAGGFSAFTGVQGLGGFFTAVGQTIATGASAIASSLGFTRASVPVLGQKGGMPGAVNTLLKGGTKAGIGAGLWRGIQAGFTAMAASSARNPRRPKTFVAGGLSRGGSSQLGPQPFFVVGGPRGTGATTAEDTAAKPDPTVAGQLPPEGTTQDSSGLLSLPEAPASKAPAITGVPEDLTPDRVGFNNASTQTPQERFFGQFRSTDITSPRDKRSFDERVFGGLLSGV